MTYGVKRKSPSRSQSRSPVRRKKLQASAAQRSRSRSGSRSRSRSPEEVLYDFYYTVDGVIEGPSKAKNIEELVENQFRNQMFDHCIAGDFIDQDDNDSQKTFRYMLNRGKFSENDPIKMDYLKDPITIATPQRDIQGGKRKTRKRHSKKRKSTRRRRRY